MADGLFHHAYRKLPRPAYPFSSGPLIGGCSNRVSAFLWGWPDLNPAAGTSLAPYKLAILVPFNQFIIFNHLRG
jgi:hypothetical protein